MRVRHILAFAGMAFALVAGWLGLCSFLLLIAALMGGTIR